MGHQFQAYRLATMEASWPMANKDRKWFASNSGRRFRSRLATGIELRLMHQLGYHPPAGMQMATAIRALAEGAILVYEHGPVDEYWGNLADLDDAGAEALFDYLSGWLRGSA